MKWRENSSGETRKMYTYGYSSLCEHNKNKIIEQLNWVVNYVKEKVPSMLAGPEKDDVKLSKGICMQEPGSGVFYDNLSVTLPYGGITAGVFNWTEDKNTMCVHVYEKINTIEEVDFVDDDDNYLGSQEVNHGIIVESKISVNKKGKIFNCESIGNRVMTVGEAQEAYKKAEEVIEKCKRKATLSRPKSELEVENKKPKR